MDKEKFTTYLQKYDYDCGAGAAGIVLLNLGSSRVNHDLLMTSLEVRRNGTWPHKLEHYFRRRGYDAESWRGGTIADLKRELSNGKLCIVLYQGPGTKKEVLRMESGHYSVVAAVSSKYVYLLDPGISEDYGEGIGWSKYKVSDFRKRWKDKWKERGREVICEGWMLSVGIK